MRQRTKLTLVFIYFFPSKKAVIQSQGFNLKVAKLPTQNLHFVKRKIQYRPQASTTHYKTSPNTIKRALSVTGHTHIVINQFCNDNIKHIKMNVEAVATLPTGKSGKGIT
ncbi:hypothetical protein [Segatella buccae]|uniref:hypothetical protein n=1 Tax=Segatella buccae TaxID=28126 RepID=UPI0028D2CE76|nr:hypothetical protein [Segatella buccae]